MRTKQTVLPIMAVFVLGMALSLQAQAAAGRTFKVRVTAEQANLREKPDIGSGIVQQIPEGTILEADKKEGEWFFVRYTLEDGGVIGGYVHESLVEVIGEAPMIAPRQEKPASEVRPGQRASASRTAKTPARSVASSPLELSLAVGAGPAAPRDLNDGAQGFADYNGAILGISATGSVNTLHLALLSGLELSYRISPGLSIGVGADYFRGANPGEVEYSDDIFSETLRTRPIASAIPVMLHVRFYPGRGFYVRGSLGVYFVKTGYLYRLERTDTWQQWKGTATGSHFGAEAALGGDWKIGEKTSVFIEAGFRMARVRGLTGQDVYSNSAGENLTEEGPLYFFRKEAADTHAYPHLFIGESKLAEAGVSGSRLADINLSGTAVKAGIRLRF